PATLRLERAASEPAAAGAAPRPGPGRRTGFHYPVCGSVEPGKDRRYLRRTGRGNLPYRAECQPQNSLFRRIFADRKVLENWRGHCKAWPCCDDLGEIMGCSTCSCGGCGKIGRASCRDRGGER